MGKITGKTKRAHFVRLGAGHLSPYQLGELRKAFGRIEAALDDLVVQIKSASIWLNAVTQKGGQ